MGKECRQAGSGSLIADEQLCDVQSDACLLLYAWQRLLVFQCPLPDQRPRHVAHRPEGIAKAPSDHPLLSTWTHKREPISRRRLPVREDKHRVFRLAKLGDTRRELKDVAALLKPCHQLLKNSGKHGPSLPEAPKAAHRPPDADGRFRAGL